MDGDAFEQYIKTQRAPTLQKGAVVVPGNLPADKRDGARRAVEKRGAWLLFLPPYAPDFNPIELAFSKFKAHMKRLKPRTIDDLWKAAGIRERSSVWSPVSLTVSKMKSAFPATRMRRPLSTHRATAIGNSAPIGPWPRDVFFKISEWWNGGLPKSPVRLQTSPYSKTTQQHRKTGESALFYCAATVARPSKLTVFRTF